MGKTLYVILFLSMLLLAQEFHIVDYNADGKRDNIKVTRNDFLTQVEILLAGEKPKEFHYGFSDYYTFFDFINLKELNS